MAEEQAGESTSAEEQASENKESSSEQTQSWWKVLLIGLALCCGAGCARAEWQP